MTEDLDVREIRVVLLCQINRADRFGDRQPLFSEVCLSGCEAFSMAFLHLADDFISLQVPAR